MLFQSLLYFLFEQNKQPSCPLCRKSIIRSYDKEVYAYSQETEIVFSIGPINYKYEFNLTISTRFYPPHKIAYNAY